MSAWTDPLWLAEAHGWIEEQVAQLGGRRRGDIDQHHVYPWSTVMRVPTASGDLYFKANSEASLWEAALVTLLAARRPDCVPPLLAVDLERGWMLMADAGTRVREIVERERDLTRWLEILPLYAGLQSGPGRPMSDEMLAARCPGSPPARGSLRDTRRCSTASSTCRQATDDDSWGSVSRVREMCEELAGYGLPETIQHDDFHDGQVFVRDGRYLLLDWGDACVSHPFFTLAVTLVGVTRLGARRHPGLGRRRAVPRRLPRPVHSNRRERGPHAPPPRPQCDWAGSAARSMGTSAARRPPTLTCGCECS